MDTLAHIAAVMAVILIIVSLLGGIVLMLTAIWDLLT